MTSILDTQLQDDTLIITVKDSLDATSSFDFKAAMIEVIKTAPNYAILDLGSMEFIDSSGIGAIVSAFRRLREQNKSLVLANVQPQPQNVFSLLQLEKVIPMFDTVDAAKVESRKSA